MCMENPPSCLGLSPKHLSLDRLQCLAGVFPSFQTLGFLRAGQKLMISVLCHLGRVHSVAQNDGVNWGVRGSP